jgi:hypothetical protein
MSVYVDVLAPQYSNDPRMDAAMQMAAKLVNPTHCYYDEVVVLLAAHMLSLGDRAGVGGAVASKSEGELSISYHAPPSASEGGLLGGTPYGQQVLNLNQLCYGMTARTAWMGDGAEELIVEPLYSGPLYPVRGREFGG